MDIEEILPEADKFIIAYSGGKDSLACILHLHDFGIPKDRIELWHHRVDGAPGSPYFMDWPSTDQYVDLTSKELDIPLYYSWKHGGFLEELLRHNERTSPISYQNPSGSVITKGGNGGKLSTRRKFPQLSADLRVRWCSAYLKVDVARSSLTDPRFDGKKIVFITGERREESPARAKYKELEMHQTSNGKRTVYQWRPVINWSESHIWEIIEKHNINPHPAYHLGWGRLSCMSCIFGNANQWATVKHIDPKRFQRISELERDFGVTIRRDEYITEFSEKGNSYIDDSTDETLINEALGMSPLSFWGFKLPKGAYKKDGGSVLWWSYEVL